MLRRNMKEYRTHRAAADHLSRAGLRLPTSAQIFSEVIAPGIEGKLEGRRKGVFESMVYNSGGEWTRDAIEVRGERLFHARGVLTWDGEKYIPCAQAPPTQSGSYDISALRMRDGLVPLAYAHRADPGIVGALYGMPFERLPERVRELGGIYLPPEGSMRPLGIGYGDNHFVLNVSAENGVRGAR